MLSLIRKLQWSQPWSLQVAGEPTGYRVLDEQLLQQVIAGEIGPAICISRYPRSLVATVRESRMAGFEAACGQLAARGWPVQVRCTGGSCVPQGPGVLNLSLIHPQLPGWKLADGYLLLCELLSELLAGYGLTVETGEVPGAFCDGRYNLQFLGRKLVGTAQRWAGSRRQQPAVLAHACLLVDLDLIEATDMINTFYRLCGSERQFEPQACTTLRTALGGLSGATTAELMSEVEQRLAGLVRQMFGIAAPR